MQNMIKFALVSFFSSLLLMGCWESDKEGAADAGVEVEQAAPEAATEAAPEATPEAGAEGGDY